MSPCLNKVGNGDWTKTENTRRIKDNQFLFQLKIHKKMKNGQKKESWTQIKLNFGYTYTNSQLTKR